jgi:hypothetical protein
MEDERSTSSGEIRTCDGRVLSALAQAGMAWLEQHYETVNALNVFPVPDGDTGTNMLLTMRSACREIEGVDDAHIGNVARLLYNGALMGARGNSGVILSQLWRGFARGIENEQAIDCRGLVRGLQEGVRMAYQAVQEPVEGTMLTVAREGAEEAVLAAQDSHDLVSVMERIVRACHESVQRTPQLLAVLAEAGVVDSGGMGLAYIVEGMLRYLRGEALLVTAPAAAARALQSALTPEDEEGYGYDVQCLIKGENMNVPAIRAQIESLGWSTLVVGDENLIKVHVHVHNPGEVLGYAATQGTLFDVVVENMDTQYETFVEERGGPQMPAPAPIQPPTIAEGTIAAVTVAPGDGLTRIFYSLGAGAVIAGGQTMNPSTKDFIEAIENLPTDRVVVLPNNKNIIMSAEQAAERVNGKQVRVVPTTTIPQGISALLALDPNGELDEVTEAMIGMSATVQTGEVTTSTRDAKIDGLRVKSGQVIGLHNDRLVVSGPDVTTVVKDLLQKMGAADLELITLYSGAGVSAAEARALVAELEALYPGHEIELREGGQAHYFYIISAE